MKIIKVTCILNDDFKIYKYPVIVQYKPDFYILNTAAKDYITGYQKAFKDVVKLSYKKKIKPLNEKLTALANKFREEGKVFFHDEIDLTPRESFPKRLVNNQIAILQKMVKGDSDKTRQEPEHE